MMNRQIHLVSRPDDTGISLDNFALVETDLTEPTAGQVVLKTLYFSLDPYMRARMYDGPNYAKSAALNQPMAGGTVAEVIDTRHPDYNVGDIVESDHGWQQYFICDPRGLRKIDPSSAPVSTALGVLGMPGQTGYGGMLRHGRPQPGETVVVSAASGAVGTVATQVARLNGCRVVGIAGGPKKCRFLTDVLGLDAAVDHKADNLSEAIAAVCPNGVDVYFDSVGGEVFAAVLPHLNTGARVPVCGTISVDRDQPPKQGSDRMQALLSTILIKQLTLRGFIFTELLDMSEAFQRDVSGWIRSDDLKYREDIVEGIENAPEAFLGLFKGANFGKLLVRP